MILASVLALVPFQTVDRNIVYRKVGDKSLSLDAYKPAQPNGRVFIAIHGGGFTGGAKGGNTGELCRFLVGRGFTCFDIDYRLQKDVGGNIQNAINAAIEDAIAAHSWVTKNASQYGGNPNKIAIGGSSAGAITALYTTYSRRVPVRAVVDLWGGMYGSEKDIRSNDPALLIVHGRNDKTVSFGLAEALNNRAKAVNLRVRFLANDGGHSLDLRTTIDHYTILEHIDSFLREAM